MTFDVDIDMMERILSNFLAKNKYPEIKEGVTAVDLNSAELESKFRRIAQLEQQTVAARRSNDDCIILGLHYAGWNSVEDRNLKKAEYWINHSSANSVGSSIILLVIHLINQQTSYRGFQEKYHGLLERLKVVNLNGQSEINYRLLRLLSGWVNDHQEFELSQDYLTLSEWIDAEHLNLLEVDRLINRWVVQDRKLELHLLANVIGSENHKLESLLGHHEGGKKNISLIRKVK